MACGQDFEADVGAGFAERKSQFLRTRSRNQRIGGASQDQHRFAGKRRSRCLRQRPHHPPQGCTREIFRREPEQGCGDVGAVGKAHCHGSRERVCRAGLIDEGGERLCLRTQIGFVEHAFREAPEEARHVVFADIAAQRKDRGARSDLTGERQQIALVATGTVQKQ